MLNLNNTTDPKVLAKVEEIARELSEAAKKAELEQAFIDAGWGYPTSDGQPTESQILSNK